MSKEEILKEFKILSEKEHRELTKGCFYQDELRDNYNKIIKILAQTREETIMEAESKISKIPKIEMTFSDIKDVLNKLKKYETIRTI